MTTTPINTDTPDYFAAVRKAAALGRGFVVSENGPFLMARNIDRPDSKEGLTARLIIEDGTVRMVLFDHGTALLNIGEQTFVGALTDAEIVAAALRMALAA